MTCLEMLLEQDAACLEVRGEEGARTKLYPELEADLLAMEGKEFPNGMQVEVHGLAKMPRYNGAWGVIRSYDEVTERYWRRIL